MHMHSPSCGCGGRRAGWPANVEVRRVTAGGVPAIVRGIIGALDSAWSHGMAGRSGAVRAGDGADPAYRFSGYLAYTPVPALQAATAATLRLSPNIGLPNTAGDVRYVLSPAGKTLTDALARLAPGGQA